jgi:enoyl-CoA hydratase
MKLIVNQAYENMGLRGTQTLGPVLDGLMRNTPEGLGFVDRATDDGVRAATNQRDAPFGDYSAGAPDRRPNAENVISAN